MVRDVWDGGSMRDEATVRRAVGRIDINLEEGF